jgi:hypothetical protein
MGLFMDFYYIGNSMHFTQALYVVDKSPSLNRMWGADGETGVLVDLLGVKRLSFPDVLSQHVFPR